MKSFAACFADLPDPRAQNALHDLTDLMFIAKILLVFAGAATAGILQPELAKADTWPGGKPPARVRAVAAIGIAFWLCAIVTGRLTAYIMLPI